MVGKLDTPLSPLKATTEDEKHSNESASDSGMLTPRSSSSSVCNEAPIPKVDTNARTLLEATHTDASNTSKKTLHQTRELGNEEVELDIDYLASRLQLKAAHALVKAGIISAVEAEKIAKALKNAGELRHEASRIIHVLHDGIIAAEKKANAKANAKAAKMMVEEVVTVVKIAFALVLAVAFFVILLQLVYVAGLQSRPGRRY